MQGCSSLCWRVSWLMVTTRTAKGPVGAQQPLLLELELEQELELELEQELMKVRVEWIAQRQHPNAFAATMKSKHNVACMCALEKCLRYWVMACRGLSHGAHLHNLRLNTHTHTQLELATKAAKGYVWDPPTCITRPATRAAAGVTAATAAAGTTVADLEAAAGGDGVVAVPPLTYRKRPSKRLGGSPIVVTVMKLRARMVCRERDRHSVASPHCC